MPLWSHSRIQSFEQCPRKFAYRYIEKPDIERVDSIEAYLGSRVHDTLEQAYKDVRMERPVSLQELLDDFEQRWLRHFHDGIRIVRRRYTADNYFQVAIRCLRDYYARHAPFTATRTLALEERIVIDLDHRGSYRLQGYIDRLSQAGDGHYEIHDYKTGGSLPPPERIEADRQLALYQIGVERRFGDARRVDLVWHYMQFDREIRSRREPQELDQLRFDTIGTIQNIEAESARGEFLTKESALCDWCEYVSVCPAKKHLHQLQDASPEAYREDDGVQLVQAYVDIMARRREVLRDSETELERLRTAIEAYARTHELEVLVGVDHKLRVRLRSGLKVPTKSTDPVARKALESRLRQLGLWDRVVALDRHALERLLESDDLTPDQQTLLTQDLVPDAGARISVSRLKDTERPVVDV